MVNTLKEQVQSVTPLHDAYFAMAERHNIQTDLHSVCTFDFDLPFGELDDHLVIETADVPAARRILVGVDIEFDPEAESLDIQIYNFRNSFGRIKGLHMPIHSKASEGFSIPRNLCDGFRLSSSERTHMMSFTGTDVFTGNRVVQYEGPASEQNPLGQKPKIANLANEFGRVTLSYSLLTAPEMVSYQT